MDRKISVSEVKKYVRNTYKLNTESNIHIAGYSTTYKYFRTDVSIDNGYIDLYIYIYKLYRTI